MTFRQTDGPAIAAAKASISLATAYRFEQDHRPPSAIDKVRTRRRPDPLADFFDAEVIPMLKAAPGLRAVAIFDEMQRRHPHLSPGARRTLERRIRSWRATHGADQEVIFRQVLEPHHISQVRQARPDDCVAVEDLPEVGQARTVTRLPAVGPGRSSSQPAAQK